MQHGGDRAQPVSVVGGGNGGVEGGGVEVGGQVLVVEVGADGHEVIGALVHDGNDQVAAGATKLGEGVGQGGEGQGEGRRRRAGGRAAGRVACRHPWCAAWRGQRRRGWRWRRQ